MASTLGHPVRVPKAVQALIDDEGREYLDDLFLSEQAGYANRPASYTGSDMLVLLREHMANAGAH